MSLKSIHIVGLGINQVADLGQDALHALSCADTIIGSSRQQECIAALTVQPTPRLIELPKLSKLKTVIDEVPGSSVVVLASGDPLYYGIGRWFSRHFSPTLLRFYPSISSVQVACHRLGVALQDVEVLSLHGRPIKGVRRKLRKNKQLIILTDKNSQPQRLAEECILAGFPGSTITVMEDLGYDSELITTFHVSEREIQQRSFSALHVSHIKVVGDGGVYPEFPGIADTLFETGGPPGTGMISKREVRLQILSMLQVSSEDTVWDVGAGCGGVAIELALWSERADVYAVECHPDRLRYLECNRDHFGVVSNLHIVEGQAPDCFSRLPVPTKVFIGGSNGELVSILNRVWSLLPEGGVMVVSAVIESSKLHLRRFSASLPSDSVQCIELRVRRGELGGECESKLPVEVYKFIKKVGQQ